MEEHDRPITETPVSPWVNDEIINRILKWAFFTVLGVLVILNVFLLPHHPHFGLEMIPGFWAFFGVIGAFILIKVCKGAAHTFLGKKEDYYDRP